MKNTTYTITADNKLVFEIDLNKINTLSKADLSTSGKSYILANSAKFEKIENSGFDLPNLLVNFTLLAGIKDLDDWKKSKKSSKDNKDAVQWEAKYTTALQEKDDQIGDMQAMLMAMKIQLAELTKPKTRKSKTTA